MLILSTRLFGHATLLFILPPFCLPNRWLNLWVVKIFKVTLVAIVSLEEDIYKEPRVYR
jgi:hypothetical protein